MTRTMGSSPAIFSAIFLAMAACASEGDPATKPATSATATAPEAVRLDLEKWWRAEHKELQAQLDAVRAGQAKGAKASPQHLEAEAVHRDAPVYWRPEATIPGAQGQSARRAHPEGGAMGSALHRRAVLVTPTNTTTEGAR